MLQASLKPIENVLCIGAHADDLEIGCGGTILELAGAYPQARFEWLVLSGAPARRAEARQSAEALLGNTAANIRTLDFRDGYFPADQAAIKDAFEELKKAPRPDLILTHWRGDHHQDHRIASELTWNTFRDHLILEYEVPKYDGDTGAPNFFVPLSDAVRQRKVAHLMSHFPSQQGRDWYTPSTFEALLRLRGVQARAPSGYAEGFFCHKLAWTPARHEG